VTQKNLALLAAALLLIIGVKNVLDPLRRGFNLTGILETWAPLLVGAIALWMHIR